MDSHILVSLITILSVSCIVAIFTEWLRQPYTIALVLVGLMVALFKITPNIHITHDAIFTLVLPPLLFYGAMHIDLEHLKNNWRSISLLAVGGVICSTFFIGMLMHYVIGLPVLLALLFGALITPTDPISVLSILKRVGAPKRLRIILEGESLFNDGTGVVIFTILLGLITGHYGFSWTDTLTKFIIITGGGAFVGLALGYLAYTFLRYIDNHLLEVAITIVLTFGTPLLAEYFHFSGVIAVVVAGLIMGNYGRIYSMSEKTRHSLENFWEVIDFVINSILFVVIGVELQVVDYSNLAQLWQPIVLTIGILLLSRLIIVYPIIALRNLVSENDIPYKWSHVIFWGGLKGSVSIALVVGLPRDVPHRELLLALAFSCVLFSLVFQGLLMKPLIRKLGLTTVAKS